MKNYIILFNPFGQGWCPVSNEADGLNFFSKEEAEKKISSFSELHLPSSQIHHIVAKKAGDNPETGEYLIIELGRDYSWEIIGKDYNPLKDVFSAAKIIRELKKRNALFLIFKKVGYKLRAVLEE